MSEDKDERYDGEVMMLSEEGINVPTNALGPVNIRPWTWGEYMKIAPDVNALFKAAEDPDVDISLLGERGAIQAFYMRVIQPVEESLEEGKELDPSLKATEGEIEALHESVQDEQRRLIMLFSSIAMYAMPIIQKTTKLKKKDIDRLMPDEVLAMFIVIYTINWATLGNPYAVFSAAVPDDSMPSEED